MLTLNSPKILCTKILAGHMAYSAIIVDCHGIQVDEQSPASLTNYHYTKYTTGITTYQDIAKEDKVELY